MKKRMVCYGTSLTSSDGWFGTSFRSTGGWVKMLDKSLPDWRVINSGKGGMNSNWGMDNFQKKVLRYNPHVVLMEFAINDAYTGKLPFYDTPGFDKSIQNIKFMIKKLKWCKVFYMTMSPPLDKFLFDRNPAEDRPMWDLFYREHRDIAHELGAEVINITRKWEALSTEKFLEYCPDGLHPNELGSKMITLPTILKRLEL